MSVLEIVQDHWGWPQWIVLAVALQRLAELVLADRNTRRLLADGATEVGAGHYWLFPVLHGTWIVALLCLVPADSPINLFILAVFVTLQVGRVWVIATLGRFWTTRILTLPNAPLITGGPFKFVRHPNYLIVTGEIAALPLAFGAWQLALVFSILNALVLAYRIRAEDAALATRRSQTAAEQMPNG